MAGFVVYLRDCTWLGAAKICLSFTQPVLVLKESLCQLQTFSLITTPSRLPTAFWHLQLQNSCYRCRLNAAAGGDSTAAGKGKWVFSILNRNILLIVFNQLELASRLNLAIRKFNETVSTKKSTLIDTQRAQLKRRAHCKAEINFGLSNTRDTNLAKEGKRGTISNCSRLFSFLPHNLNPPNSCPQYQRDSVGKLTFHFNGLQA